MWSLNSFTLLPTDSLCGGGRTGEDAPGKGTILGAERHAGGTSFPLGLEKRHTAGQGSQGLGWPSLVAAGQALRGPPFLFSVSGTVSNRKV